MPLSALADVLASVAVPTSPGAGQAPVGGSLNYAVGPAIALVAIAALLLACRWVFSTGHRTGQGPTARSVRATAPASPPLLVRVVAVPERSGAEAARSLLADAGVRGLVVPTAAGHELRVFPGDEARAREVLRRR